MIHKTTWAITCRLFMAHSTHMPATTLIIILKGLTQALSLLHTTITKDILRRAIIFLGLTKRTLKKKQKKRTGSYRRTQTFWAEFRKPFRNSTRNLGTLMDLVSLFKFIEKRSDTEKMSTMFIRNI